LNAGIEFQRITQLTSRMFEVPIAIITILDEHRQWFKAPVGVDMEGSLRTDAFCDHTIRNEGIMVIPDAHLDSRFASNPMVTGNPHIRFYAGVPLILESGHAVGSLCIIDTKPREFSEAQRQQMTAMAEIVKAQIDYFHKIGKIDEVTGLRNRAQLKSDLNSLCMIAPGAARSLVLMEAINHSSLLEMSNALGLHYVEQLLRDIAAVVTQMTGAHATVYHVGLARFAWIISAGDEEDEEGLIRQLLEHLRKPITSADLKFELQPRAGVARFHLTPPEVDDVIRKAMVSVQQAGYNDRSFHRYEAQEDSRQQRSYRLLRDFGHALERGQLRLIYQPKFDNHSFSCKSLEALIRWTHPGMGEIPPSEFIPLVETTPLIHSLTRFVVKTALAQIAAWKAEHIDLEVSINISPRNLDDPDFPAYLKSMCLQYGVPLGNIVVECTESDILTGTGTVQALQNIRKLGVKVALDDFGAAYSNLASLKSLPAEILKIDRSMVCDIDTNERALSVLKSIMMMASDLGYRLVAEGVDSAQIFDMLVSLGFDEIQGYYFSKPMEASEVKRFIEERNKYLQAMQ
jgi:EAL domain-containing protein (putative c-di-GMP-specific phosphodiesterase class I)/GGDEF domain-containing protein